MRSGFNFFKNWLDITPTIAKQWNVIGVAGLVPANATGVILRVANLSWQGQCYFRKFGSTNDFVEYGEINRNNHAYVFCGIDASYRFEAYCEQRNSDDFTFKIYLCGFTDEAVTFFTDVIPLGPIGSTFWSPWDISSYIPIDATGVIIYAHNTHPTTGAGWVIRAGGSTDEHWGGDEYGWHTMHMALGVEAPNFIYALVGLGDRKIEMMGRGLGAQGYITPHLVGYTKAPVHFFINTPVKTIGVSNSWRTISLPEAPNADGVIAELRNIAPGGKAIDIRKPGSTNTDMSHSRVSMETSIWAGCGVGLGNFQANCQWAEKALLFIHGYSKPSEGISEKTVELGPGESQLVSFEAVPHEAGVYQVKVNGLEGTFRAVEGG